MMSRTLRYLLVIGGSVVSILLFLLASAAENTDFFDKYYSLLIAVNMGSAAALLLLVSVLLTRLVKRYRKRKFGSRLMARLVFLFGIIGILPGLVIYVVSVQFVSRSIESWFDIRVESALEAGLNLGRVSLQSSLDSLSNRGSGLAQEMADAPESAQTMILARLRDPNIEASLLNENGQIIANYSNSTTSIMASPVSPATLRRARDPGGYAAIDSEDVTSDGKNKNTGDVNAASSHYSSRLKLRVIFMVPRSLASTNLYKPAYFVQLTQDVPAYLATNAEALRAASSEYQERSLARSGLRKIYLVTLTLTLLLAIFGALAGAFLIANDLARPLLLLAEGTRAVTEGNLSPRPISTSNDELGLLTQSFNEMTRQLSDARASVDRNRLALQNANAFLESVLGNMTAGVMVFDGQLKLVTINQSVQRILHVDLTDNIGRTLDTQAMLKPFSDVLHRAMGGGVSRRRNDDLPHHWQQQIELQRSDEDNSPEISVLARGSRLPVDGRSGMVVVFDDISDVISAHRSIAWGEVARRLAHEIKNPLTPIQLSAERLEHKLESQLTSPEAKKLLKRSTETIVNQVAAMKRMVDDFRDYARTPPAVMEVVELNKLVMEILHLYLAGDGQDIIHSKLAATLPLMMGDSTQLRQVIHNLLQNAQDAVNDPAMRATDAFVPRIDIETSQILTDEDMTGIRFSIIDNGSGFSPKILPRAFEPYVTSKARGTGLGLPMVKKIIEEHGGSIALHNRSDQRGARIDIVFTKLASELLISGQATENRPT